MVNQPNCFKRKCVHYIGVVQPDGTENIELHVCSAFPKGIPDKIAYGSNLHLRPLPNQDNDIVFQKNKT